MARPGEMVTVVNEHDYVTGAKKFEEITDDERFRVVQIWVENFKGQALIAKRAAAKKLEPNLWELGASGTVTYPDSYEESAKRELEEELGIKANNLLLEKVLFYKKPFSSRACGMFRAKVDDNVQLKLQEDEVAEVKWVDIKELKQDYSSNRARYTSEVGRFLEYYAP